jgi:putative ABC transport system permease protein
MLLQLLLVGYVLTYIFESERGLVVVGVLIVMLLAASGIALRPISRHYRHLFWIVCAAIVTGGVSTLVIVTQFVFDLDRWYEPTYLIPLGGMIFSNCMNSISLAAERFEAERQQDRRLVEARRTAMNAAMIPQINTLLAVGIVALPGMMTGQILSGSSPLIAIKYQIMIMVAIFSGTILSVFLGIRLTNFFVFEDTDMLDESILKK